MPNAPTVFTPHNIALIRTMKRAGASNKAIADAIGSTSHSVQARCAQLKLEKRYRFMKTRVSEACADAFERQAAKRNMTPTAFLKLMLHTVANEDLFRAVLDD